MRVGLTVLGSFKKQEKSASAIGEQKRSSLPLWRRASAHACPWNRNCIEDAAFRLRAAHSGGEDRPPAEWQPPLRTPPGARIAAPAHLWTAKGASWMCELRPVG